MSIPLRFVALSGLLAAATASSLAARGAETPAGESAVTESKVPVVYVVPMSGQMGTDIHPSIYDEVVKDVMEVQPDVIVYQLKSADIDNNFYLAGNDDRREFGLA